MPFGISFSFLSSAAAAAEQDKKRDDDYPDAFVVEDIAKTVVHICSVSPPSENCFGTAPGGQTDSVKPTLARSAAAMYAAKRRFPPLCYYLMPAVIICYFFISA